MSLYQQLFVLFRHNIFNIKTCLLSRFSGGRILGWVGNRCILVCGSFYGVRLVLLGCFFLLERRVLVFGRSGFVYFRSNGRAFAGGRMFGVVCLVCWLGFLCFKAWCKTCLFFFFV